MGLAVALSIVEIEVKCDIEVAAILRHELGRGRKQVPVLLRRVGARDMERNGMFGAPQGRSLPSDGKPTRAARRLAPGRLTSVLCPGAQSLCPHRCDPGGVLWGPRSMA